jgi:hypothetical protein
LLFQTDARLQLRQLLPLLLLLPLPLPPHAHAALQGDGLRLQN